MSRTIFRVDFRKQGGGNYGHARLNVDLPFAPTTDLEFRHPALDGAKKPVLVSYDLENGEFVVDMDHRVFSNDDAAEQCREMYKGHGWEVSE